MKKLYLLSILTLTTIALIYSCSTEEEDTTTPPSVVATPEPEPPAPTQYTLTVTAGEGGSVSTEGGTYDEGTEITITATPNDGYEFIGWEGSDSDSNSLTVTLNGDTSVQAIFLPETFLENRESIELCKLDRFYGAIGFGFPKYIHSLPSTGNLKFTLIFVDFDDSPATATIEEMKQLIEPISKSFYSSSSYGKLNVQFDAINKWIRMTKNSGEYNMRREVSSGEFHYNYLLEALNLADSEYDFSNSDLFVVITNPDTENIDYGPAYIGNDYWNFQADGKTFYTSTSSGYDLNVWGGLWLNHEVGHLMGLPDLYNYSGYPLWHGYVGQFSLMGLISGEAPDLFGYEKWMLGWLDDAQIFCAQNGTSIVDIHPIESTDTGTKIVVLPISDNNSLVIESRKSILVDENLTEEGILIYRVDSSIDSGQGCLEVLPSDRRNDRKIDLLLKEGDILSINGYSIEVLLQSDLFDRVSIVKE
jgi:M6 family metalloprotease-like protein